MTEGQRAFRAECPQCKRKPYNVEVECKIGPDYLKFTHTTPECGYTFDIPRRDLKTFEGLTYIEIWDKWLNKDKEDDSTESAIKQVRYHLGRIMQILDGMRTPT